MKILKNTTANDLMYLGQTILANDEFEIPSDKLVYWANDSQLLIDIASGDVVVNDGSVDIADVNGAINYLKDNLPKNIVVTDGIGNIANQLDIDNAMIVRVKASKKGWSFWALPVELNTSTLNGSIYAKDSLGTDIPGISCKIYDGSNAEITTAGLLDVNLAACVKTVLDIEPAFDFEMIGGSIRINSNPSQDVRMWIVGAPDIPAIYGGSKEFASGINLKFLAPDSSFEIDGRVTKYVVYSATTHSGKLRVILKHPAGLNLNLQVIVHMYRL